MRGGSGVKRYSARAPSSTTHHGRPRPAIVARTPAVKRSCSAVMRSNASAVSTASSVARAEYRFTPEPPRTGAESAAAADTELEDYLHLALLNRGVLITPFHNMALMSPATTEAEVDRHTEAFADAVAALVA